MANPERGEKSIEIDGAEYTLVMDLNAIRSVEAELSTATKDAVFNDILKAAERGQYRAISGLFWASLLRHHKLSMAQVDELIDKAGMEQLAATLAQAVVAGQPTQSQVSAAVKRPRKA